MEIKGPKEVLRNFCWVYIFFILVAVVLSVVFGFMPNVPDDISSLMTVTTDADIRLVIVTALIVGALFNLVYLWLLKKYVDGKSSGLLFMMLLFLGVIYSLICIASVSTIYILNLLINVLLLLLMVLDNKKI